MRLLEALRDTLWGWHTLLLILTAGLFFSVRSRFYPLRHPGRWLTAAGGSRARGRGVSAFQALSTALGGSLGTGNIVGVGAAIAAGGPGALFWMWVSALLGMMTAYAENVLAVKYRGTGKHRAPGALAYIRAVKAWGGPLASIYAVGCVLASLAMGNMVQAGACAAALGGLGLPPVMTGLLLSLLLFFVARGGMLFASRITDKLVPAMSLLFLLASLGVLWIFRHELPGAVRSIFTGAFSFRAGAGGAIGGLLALKTGISRGVFSNEAGLGSAAFAYSRAEGCTAEDLGLLGIFQVFVDTILLCTLTGLCILCSPCRAAGSGAALCLSAYRAALGSGGGAAVSLCTALFGLATMVAWCCYGRDSLFYLSGGRGRNGYALLAAGAAFLGCVLPLEAALVLGDACNGLMAAPNLAALFCHRDEVWDNNF